MLRVRKGQVDDGNHELEALNAENDNLEKVNNEANEDL